mmetsp:Transcript_81280/g.235702  ORF Transcript_81280/g.235702 Transcript_81280/m.235702 type:complete len:241 (+) Transcript_81280:551-1273(+)
MRASRLPRCRSACRRSSSRWLQRRRRRWRARRRSSATRSASRARPSYCRLSISRSCSRTTVSSGNLAGSCSGSWRRSRCSLLSGRFNRRRTAYGSKAVSSSCRSSSSSDPSHSRSRRCSNSGHPDVASSKSSTSAPSRRPGHVLTKRRARRTAETQPSGCSRARRCCARSPSRSRLRRRRSSASPSCRRSTPPPRATPLGRRSPPRTPGEVTSARQGQRPVVARRPSPPRSTWRRPRPPL